MYVQICVLEYEVSILFSVVLYPILLPRPIRPDQFLAVYLPRLSVALLPVPSHLDPSAFSEYHHEGV
jgi:hypothetical protein